MIADLVLTPARAQCALHRTDQSLRTNRPLQQQNIPKRLAQFAAALAVSTHPPCNRQQNQRKIGPGGLLQGQICKCADEWSSQRFLADQKRSSAFPYAVEQQVSSATSFAIDL